MSWQQGGGSPAPLVTNWEGASDERHRRDTGHQSSDHGHSGGVLRLPYRKSRENTRYAVFGCPAERAGRSGTARCGAPCPCSVAAGAPLGGTGNVEVPRPGLRGQPTRRHGHGTGIRCGLRIRWDAADTTARCAARPVRVPGRDPGNDPASKGCTCLMWIAPRRQTPSR